MDQARAEIHLKLGDALADRRLRNAERRAAAAKPPLFTAWTKICRSLKLNLMRQSSRCGLRVSK